MLVIGQQEYVLGTAWELFSVPGCLGKQKTGSTGLGKPYGRPRHTLSGLLGSS